MHVMIDLETMSTDVNAAIIAIGACKFDVDRSIIDKFYCTISLQSAVEFGGVVDPSTIIWWMQQEEAARSEAISGTNGVHFALTSFTQWLGNEPLVGVWGNGAAFDNVILAQAYRRIGMDTPWSYKLDRCYRTVCAKHPDVEFKNVGVHHNALDDAVAQARHLMKIWELEEGQATGEAYHGPAVYDQCHDHGPAVYDQCHDHEKSEFNYPERFKGRVPKTVRITPEGIGHLVAPKGEVFPAWTNRHGAVSAILPSGKKLGLLPSEYEVEEWLVEDPE